MSISFIDRDPEAMIQYGHDAAEIVEQMTTMVRRLEVLLDAYAADLDDNSRSRINTLHECCNSFVKTMDTYTQVALTVQNKGERLLRVREEG